MKQVVYTVLLLIAVATVVACSKGKFESRPTLELKEQNTDVLPQGATLQLVFEFTDKEGDVTDSLVVVRQRLNKKGPSLSKYDLPIPSFPKTTSGEFEVNLDGPQYIYVGIPGIPIPGSGTPPKLEPDTMLLKFVAVDAEGNRSDTARANVIVIR